MTNIRLDPALWTRVKAAAGEHGTTLERWVSDALEARLSPATARRGANARRGGESGPLPSAQESAQESAMEGSSPSRNAGDGELQALQWRVEALETTVDYLAGIVGAGFPLGRSRPADAPADSSPGGGGLTGGAAASSARGLPSGMAAAAHERGPDER